MVCFRPCMSVLDPVVCLRPLPCFSLSFPSSSFLLFSPSPPSPSSTNLSELAKAVRMLAALTPTEGEGSNLLDAARALAAATADLLNSAHPENLSVSGRGRWAWLVIKKNFVGGCGLY